MVDKSTFISKVNELSIDTKITEDLIKAYDLYASIQFGGNPDPDLLNLPDHILKVLFSNPFDFSIPMSFINSPIGEVLFKIKFNLESEAYFTPLEISIIINKTKSLISYDIKNELLVASKHGKNLVITKSSLINYMNLKGFTHEMSIKKINSFLKLKNSNTPLKEIKFILNPEA